MSQHERIGWAIGTACTASLVLMVPAIGTRPLGGILGSRLIDSGSDVHLARPRNTRQRHRPAYIVTRDGSGRGTLPHWSHLPAATRIEVAILAGVSCAALWVASFPSVPRAAGSMPSAADRQAMFGHIAEMLPVKGPMPTPHHLLIVVLAAAPLVWLALRQRSIVAGYAALCAMVRIGAGQRHVRFSACPETVAATDAALALFCPSAHRSPLLADLPRETLLHRANQSDVPSWLWQVAANPASGNILYRILR